jgi:CDP-diglyceride synthetase
MSGAAVLTSLLAYNLSKKTSTQMVNRPGSIHLKAFIALGQGFYILGQYFLLTSGANLIVGIGWLISLVVLGFVVSDIQDYVARKNRHWLYLAIMSEFVLWALLTLIALMSARYGEGALLFLACFSRVADLFLLYIELAEKEL